MIVDQPPLPPHERPWRHPSELGPTRHEIDDGGAGTWTLAVATGAVACVALAVMLVAVLPQQAADPLAMSATTAPVVTVRVVRTDTTADSARAGLVAMNRIPNEVSSAGLRSIEELQPATELPDDRDPVIVLTDEFTYWVEWSALPRLILPEDSLVLHAGGDLIGRVVDGQLVLSVDDD